MSAAAKSPAGFVFLSKRADTAQLDSAANTTTESALVFASVERDLQSAGLEFHDILRTRLLYTSRDDYPEMNVVRDPLFRARFPKGDFPAASGFVTGGQGGVRPNFDLEVIAHPSKRAFNANGVIQEWSGVRPPFTHANIAGDVLFAAGQGPYNEAGGLAADDPIGQAVITLGVLDKVLKAGGCSRSDILCLTAYISPRAALEKRAILVEIDAFIGNSGHGAASIINVIVVHQLFKPGMEVAMELAARTSPTNPLTCRPSKAARATRYKTYLAASSEIEGPEGLPALFNSALADLRTSLNGVGAKLQDIGLLTLWFSSGHDRRELEGLARQAVGPKAALTLAPMASPGIFLEALGSLPESDSAQ